MAESIPAVQRSILSSPALAQLVLSHYNLPDSATCQFWNHSINDTYLIKAGDSKFMLRVSPTDWRTIEQINAELDLLKFLHQHRLSVPQPVPQKDGASIQILMAPEGPRHAVLFTFLPGALADMSETVSRRYGKAVAQLHAITDDYPIDRAGLRFDPVDMVDEPITRIKTLFTEHRADYDYLLDISPALKQATDKLLHTAPQYGICHGDLNAGNFHIHKDGGWSLVDFEYFGYGWRIFDIATFFNTQLVDRGMTNETKNIVEAFLEGYQEVRSLNKSELDALPSFVIIRQIWLLGTSARYIPKSTVGVALHEQWLFQHVMPFIREWMKET